MEGLYCFIKSLTSGSVWITEGDSKNQNKIRNQIGYKNKIRYKKYDIRRVLPTVWQNLHYTSNIIIMAFP